MNKRIEDCLYQAGLTAQGCWDELDDYAKQGIEKFAELIIQECIVILNKRKDAAIDADWLVDEAMSNAVWDIEEHFGLPESEE